VQCLNLSRLLVHERDGQVKYKIWWRKKMIDVKLMHDRGWWT
jgi:hypothetical protein